MNYDYEVLVIGAGSAGLAAARQAAQYSKRVAIVERDQIGGCCVNRGCVPKKIMVYAADYAAEMRNSAAYAWGKCDSMFDWQQFRAKRDRELQRLRQQQQRSLEEADVRLLQGEARFLDAHTLAVAGQKYTAENIIIAVGGKPIKLDIPGIEYTITSNELINIEHLPHHIAIIGGGYIGVEFASILRGMGCDVSLIEQEPLILEGFDDDVRIAVQAGLIDRGIKHFGQTSPEQIQQTAEGFCLHLDNSEKITADVILCAIGRAPCLEGLGLEATGVEFNRKAIVVDEHSRTTQPHIYAVGDCSNRKQLTPVAKAEGRAAAKHVLGQTAQPIDYQQVASAVLSRPEAASVGLTETQAREKYGDQIECYRKEFVPLRFSLVEEPQQGLIKLVVEQESDRILGIHMVGEGAAEIVQVGAIALAKNMTRRGLMGAIGIHPSTAEELFSL
jgi:glutathione reductase (NADPH)